MGKESEVRGYRTYENDEIRVFWYPDICRHAGKCTGGSGAVFDPQRRPWIDLSKASAREIAGIIDQCPSGALKYEWKTPISIIFDEENHRSVALDGEREVGECELSIKGDTWTIVHTGVRRSYEGRGIASRLVLKIVEEARKRKVKVRPLCTYAVRMLTGKEEYRDLL